MDELQAKPRRTQDRTQPPAHPAAEEMFNNEPDTDFALEANQRWAKDVMQRWESREVEKVPLCVGDEECWDDCSILEGFDPSRPGKVVVRSATADAAHIDRAFQTARQDPTGWRARSASDRREVMRATARLFRERRGELMGAAMAECGKILTESDPEVSEAIDFLEYYGLWAERFDKMENLTCEGRGVAVVIPPWNFPIAIPCGGVAAALVAGNTVILKPSPDAVMTARHLCQCFWDAGVPRAALQFVPTPSVKEAEYLVGHPEVDVVIFTGGTETAKTILRHRPDLEFFAETGGKNATIVTALSDRDLAIKHVLHSAFSHSGQKCSATSLLILEDEVYHDPVFKEGLRDAVCSMEVGSAWTPSTKVGPVIRPPNDALKYGLSTLEEGESWLVEPRQDPDNPLLFSPGVRWGVQPRSPAHLTEFFGPVLGVMRAQNILHAINLVHETGYGLTSGLESLDDREQELWQHRVKAGNLYMNRPTTGAIVHRQPFGGMGKSAYGPGIKAGGPNYVLQFMKITETALPETAGSETDDDFFKALFAALKDASVDKDVFEKLRAALGSYRLNMEREFSQEHDDFKLIGQDNIRRYLPVQNLRIRLHETDSMFDVLARICAARVAGCQVTISCPPGCSHPALSILMPLLDTFTEGLEQLEESDADLAKVMSAGHVDRVRFASKQAVPEQAWALVPDTGIYLAHAPVLMEGRLELLWYLREQSLSVDYHRYGNLGGRSAEERDEPL
jgi:RHH-type proline utilization regulon transcriptional repressor/proline dehydrogenase/delta 1-pyrroline-5-carboxylate dehydrogenase